MKPNPILLLLLLAAAAAPVHAAVVRLKEGGSIEGKILSADGREVVVQTSGGPRRIPADRVQGIDYEAAPPPAPLYNPAPVGAGESRMTLGGQNLISFGLGLAAPLSDVDFTPIGGGSASNGDVGPLIGIRYLRNMNKRFAAGLDFDYLHRSATNSSGLLPFADASVTGDNLVFMAIGRWYLVEEGGAKPYLLGGAGVSRSWTYIDAAPIRGFAWSDTNTDEVRRLVDDGVWAFASTARLGVDFDWEFAEPSVFSLEAGWTGLASRRYAATRFGRDLGLDSVGGRLNLFILTARWSWRW
jgi:hypothetical protein